MKKHISRIRNPENFYKNASSPKRKIRRKKKNILISLLQRFFKKQKLGGAQ